MLIPQRAEEYCLTFANTVNWHASAQPQELLHSYADLLAWAERAGVISAATSQRLAQHAQHIPAEAAVVFQRATELREAVYRICVAQIEGRAPAANDLARINVELANALTHARLVPSAAHFAWTWTDDERTLEAVLWPLVRSIADLLTSAELLARVGQCADDRGCGWLFLDLSKNRSRRWCDINDCGNRAKQRRHYARAKVDRATKDTNTHE